MNTLLKRLAVRMVFETANSSVAPAHLIGLSCRTEAHLATRLNKIERRSYEVIIFIIKM